MSITQRCPAGSAQQSRQEPGEESRGRLAKRPKVLTRRARRTVEHDLVLAVVIDVDEERQPARRRLVRSDPALFAYEMVSAREHPFEF